MDLQIEQCITDNNGLPAQMVTKLLGYRHSLTYVLIDLQLLEEKITKPGKETAAESYLSGEELGRLSKFTSPKRKLEWLGGRFVAKLATARLFEQVESEVRAYHYG